MWSLGISPVSKKRTTGLGVARGRSRGSRNYLETGTLRQGMLTTPPAAVRTTNETSKRAICLSPFCKI